MRHHGCLHGSRRGLMCWRWVQKCNLAASIFAKRFHVKVVNNWYLTCCGWLFEPRQKSSGCDRITEQDVSGSPPSWSYVHNSSCEHTLINSVLNYSAGNSSSYIMLEKPKVAPEVLQLAATVEHADCRCQINLCIFNGKTFWKIENFLFLWMTSDWWKNSLSDSNTPQSSM